jgi:hypothetical protein
MRYEAFRMKDYAKLTQGWWYSWHGNAINDKLLSRFGIAVLDDNSEPMAIAYLYPVSTCDMVWIGFTVRDPSLSRFKAGKALKLLVQGAEDTVKSLGYSIIYTAYDAKALQKLVRDRGYYAGSQVQEYFKELT